MPNDVADYERAPFVVLPVPFDKESTWVKGADKGPSAIMEASHYLEFYDIETDSDITEKGIFTAKPILARSSSILIKKTELAVSRYIKDNKFVVAIGGDHSIAIGVIKTFAGAYEDLSVLHLDAHADSRDSYEGSKYSHACVIARTREWTENIVSVGIRSMDISERSRVDKKRMFFAHDIHNNDKWIPDAVEQLTGNIYVTIDLDVFDPAFMPSTGTPEPGGLGWYQVMKLLHCVAQTGRVVGFDVVELCPSHSKGPDFLAAKLIYTLLSYVNHYGSGLKIQRAECRRS